MSYDPLHLLKSLTAKHEQALARCRLRKKTAMRPFGYEVDRFSIREAEADLIRHAAQSVLAGESIRSVASAWNDAGATTSAGNGWKSIVVRRMLTSLRIAGMVKRKDGVIIAAPWPPIIDTSTHERLSEILTDTARANAPTPITRTYLLTGGVARCGLCGTPLVARPDNNGKRGYVCASGTPAGGCGKIRINGRLLEDEVGNRLIARLIKGNARSQIDHHFDRVTSEAAVAQQTVKLATARLSVLGEEYAQGSVSAAAMRSANRRLKDGIAEARGTIRKAEALGSVAVLEADSLIEWWEGASLNQQRTLLTVLAREITVSSASVKGSKTFDPSRVKVNWR